MKLFELDIDGYGHYEYEKERYDIEENTTIYFGELHLKIEIINNSLNLFLLEDMYVFTFNKDTHEYEFLERDCIQIDNDIRYNIVINDTRDNSYNGYRSGFLIELVEQNEDNNTDENNNLYEYDINKIINFELSKINPDLNVINNLLIETENLKPETIQSIIDCSLILDFDYRDDFLKYFIKKELTPFCQFYKEIKNKQEIDPLTYLQMLFSSYYNPSLEPRYYYYIILKLEEVIKGNNDIKNIIKELENLLNDDKLLSIYQKIKHLLPISIFITKENVKNEIYYLIKSMINHLTSYNYINVSFSDKVFFNYLPSTKHKYSKKNINRYFDYDIKIFLYIKNLLSKENNIFDIYYKLQENYDLLYKVDYIFGTKKNNRHFMNLFVKEFGRFKFREQTSLIIRNMINKLLEPKDFTIVNKKFINDICLLNKG